MADDKIKNLYNEFVKNGYDMEPEDEFRENLKDPNKRKAAYDALISDGYDMEEFGEFENNIGYGSQSQTSQQPNASGAPLDGMVDSNGYYQPGKGDMAYARGGNDAPTVAPNDTRIDESKTRPVITPRVEGEMRHIEREGISKLGEMNKEGEIKGYESGKSNRQTAYKEWKDAPGHFNPALAYHPSEEELKRFKETADKGVASIKNMGERGKRSLDYIMGKEGAKRDFTQGSKAGEAVTIPVGRRYDALRGEFVEGYLTESGDVMTKSMANAQQSIIDEQNRRHNRVGEIYEAWKREHPNASAEERERGYAESAQRFEWLERMKSIDSDIEAMEDARDELLDEIYDSGIPGMKADHKALRKRDRGWLEPDIYKGSLEGAERIDPRVAKMSRAIEELKEAKARYERGEFNLESNGFADFFRGLGAGAKEMLNNPFGLVSLRHGIELKDMADRINKGDKLSKEEDELLDAILFNQQTQELSRSAGAWYNIGEGTALVAEMCAEFALNPASGLTRGAILNATKAFGKGAAKKILSNPKTLAKIAGAAVTEGAVIAGTTQGAKTAGEALQRTVGAPVYDAQGNVTSFEGGDSMGVAVAKSTAKATLTNAIFLPHMGIGKGFGWLTEKGVGKAFGEKGAAALNAVNDWFAGASKILPFSNPVEGAVKMKSSELLSVMFGDESISDWADVEKNAETLGVLLASEFMMGAPRKVRQIGKYSDLTRCKAHAARCAADAVNIFAEREGGLVELDAFLRSFSEAKDSKTASELLALAGKHLSEREAKALVDLAGAVCRYNGARLAYEAEYGRRKSQGTRSETSVESEASEESEVKDEPYQLEESNKPGSDDYYAEGYSADEPGVKKDMRLAWESERERLVSEWGEDRVAFIDANEELVREQMAEWDSEEREAIERYLNAKAAYDGVIERVRDNISEEVRKHDAMIDSRTNADTGTVIEVRLTDGRQMWVTSGKLARLDNGDVDRGNSSDMLVVVDANGKAESTAPNFIASIENEVDPAELKRMAAGKISNEMAERASVEIDGIVSFTSGERVRMLTEDGGEPVEVVISGDTVDEQGAPVAGMVDVVMPDGSVMSMSRDDVQRGADAADALRVSQARALDETDKSDESYKSYKPEEVETLLARMETGAEPAPYLELTPDNWRSQFGEEGTVDTPIGAVKMGENQFNKLQSLNRAEYFGMIKPTLSNPDVVIEETDPKDGAERDSKYLFIKTFVKQDGSRIVHFESVTVRKDGMEVSISSHEVKETALKNKMQNGKILHLSERLSPDSERRLTKTPNESERPDLVPTSDSSLSGDKVTTNNPPEQERVSAVERVPRDEQGKPMLDAVEPEVALDVIEEKLPDGGSQRKFIENQIKRSKANLREAENARSVDVDDIDAFAEAE